MTSNALLYTAEQQLKVKKLLAFTITVADGQSFVFRLCPACVNGIAKLIWGDGNEEAVPYNGTSYGQRMAHAYVAAGSYQIEIYADTLRSFRFTQKSAALVSSVDYWHKDLFTAPELFIHCVSATFPASIPDGVEHIRYYTFYDADAMTSMLLPASVKRVDDYAFVDASAITSVTFRGIPDFIGAKAFQNDAAIANINVPWSYGEVANAPWGAVNAVINYNQTV